ncbi:MAG: hypothetical protein IKG89_07495 [Oscillospiraceae bacterium]|nr:hypothetical protein [Oscillospiraceae bacterium]
MEARGPVVALIGERAEETALAEAAPVTEICGDTGIPFFPALGIRQNAVDLRMVMKPEQQALFWELLKVSGLRRAGWNLPFRKDQPGKLRMWGMVLALTLQTGPVLAIEPMAGMTPEDRTDFADLLRYCQEHGLCLRYTAYRLKDVMELEYPHPLRLALPEGWRDTGFEEMERDRAALGEKAGWDKLQLTWEGEEDG